jgi:demethylmenaquinone methyltransferase/2-methoxy-6-polyprenyl-1,4-benzoquinol methylase
MGTRITPYTSPDQETKTRQVARMFDNIAHSYDLLNHLFSFGIDVLWRKRAVRILKKENPKRIMDMATGTADFAIEAVRMGLSNVHITGVDISQGMLEVGRKKVAKRGYQDVIELMEGDSVSLPFETGHFDAYTVAFGVRNFEQLEAGLSEMLRTLRPGGLGVILEFSKPRKFPMKQLFAFYFKFIMPTIGKLVSKDQSAYAYLPESVQAFPEGQDFLNVLEKVGYVACEAVPLTGGIASIYLAYKPEA